MILNVYYVTQPREDNWVATYWKVSDLIKKVDIIRLDGA